MADQKMVRYEAEIVGHRAPFKWRLFRIAPGLARSMVQHAQSNGESDSYGAAVCDAADAAEIVHDQWLHANTKEIETVFEGSPKPPAQMAAEAADRELELWASNEFDGMLVAEPVRPPTPTGPAHTPVDEPDPSEFAD